MKKVYVNGNGKLDASQTGEAFALYYGIEAVYGDYILETGGNPTCLNELEDAGDEAEALRNAIDALIDDPATPWQACDAADEAYVAQWLRIWGLG
nr:MAG TPA: hypothetical protein [Caudoviricetes sp.]